MLIDNKFIYISLPRRGSTSFHYSCLINNLKIKNLTESWEHDNNQIDFTKIDEKNIMNLISHGHEPLVELKRKFGDKYPIIAVQRNRHETFHSLFKHVIFDLERAGFGEISNHFKKLNNDELFFFKTSDLTTKKKRWDLINDYLLNNKLLNERKKTPINLVLNSEEYVINIIDILLTPASFWHNHDKNIIWFDIKNLSKMEEWIRNITGKPFNLKNVNSSSYVECESKIDDDFIKNYDNIYDFYDNPKKEMTFI